MAKKIDIADALRQMEVGETREFKKPTVVAVAVTKFGPDEFRCCGDLPTSYPNTVRLLRGQGLEEVADWK